MAALPTPVSGTRKELLSIQIPGLLLVRGVSLMGRGLQRAQSHSPTPNHFLWHSVGTGKCCQTLRGGSKRAGLGGGLGGGFSPVGCERREMTIFYTSV